jgi:hypothetical protein
MNNDMDAMAFILVASRDMLRANHNWKKGECRLSFETTPISNGARKFVGLEEVGITNGATEIDTYNSYEHSIRVGVWRDAAAIPNDREGILLEDDDMYLRDRQMLHDLETCVRRTLQSWELVECVNDYLGSAERPNCYPPVLSQLRFAGRSETEIITEIPEINVLGGRWARRLLTFTGMRQIVER